MMKVIPETRRAVISTRSEPDPMFDFTSLVLHHVLHC
jgi:hypothetical protein